MRATAWGRVCLLACASLAFCAAAMGQTNGAIRGIVNDPSGAVVPGVTVTATLTGQATPRIVTSDKDGAFDIPELPVGTYDVSAEATGFKKFLAKDVVVTIGHVNFITVTLAGWREERYGDRGSERCAGGDHQHSAGRSDDGHVDPRASFEHAERLRAAPASTWRAIAIGRGSVCWQRQSRAWFP